MKAERIPTTIPKGVIPMGRWHTRDGSHKVRAHHEKLPQTPKTITATGRKDASPMEITEEQNISSAVDVTTRGHIPPTDWAEHTGRKQRGEVSPQGAVTVEAEQAKAHKQHGERLPQMISTANALSYIILKNRVVNMYAYIRRQDYESVKG